ncbi:VOC family protein [Pseudoalteromonas spongiae]|uniref:VOC family protein n=1 Tax=Pseudoalteromonas spongiae TaxID=298657 RepID=UPI000C2D4020|nr:VOC family protein [Pseudoalteromonas spongiae]TMO82742.1 VOC family protein [Pseudoalteromonas spongiae]
MQHEKINYLEFPASDLSQVKAFFNAVFAFEFTDYGPEYTAFNNAGIDGGFYLSDNAMTVAKGSALVVFYSANLAETQDKITAAGGKVVVETFEFPGGKRFHFSDPCGNEFAVWSDK